MRWAGHVAREIQKLRTYRVLVGKPEGKGLLRRPAHIWEDDIEVDLTETEWEDVELDSSVLGRGKK